MRMTDMTIYSAVITSTNNLLIIYNNHQVFKKFIKHQILVHI